MKHKKGWIAVAVLFAVGWCAMIYFSTVHVSLQAQVEADSYGNTCRLSDGDAEQICKAFSGKKLYFDNPACGFDEDFLAVRVGKATFLPGMDSCGTVKYGMMFFQLSNPEMSALRSILAKYDIDYFPAV